MNRDELIEVAWQAWLANGITAKAGVMDAVDAVEPIIRADERVGMGPLWRGGVAEVEEATLADLRAKVEGLRDKKRPPIEVTGLSDDYWAGVTDAYSVVLALIGGVPDGS